MELVAAKCPSCGANIKLDEKRKTAFCTYCGSNIIVKEAKEKYQIELSGKIKVSGIKDEEDKIEIAKKYIKLKDIENAKIILDDILKINPFNYEALKLSNDIDLEGLKDIVKRGATDTKLYSNINKRLNVIETLDDDNKHIEYINQLKEELNILGKKLVNNKNIKDEKDKEENDRNAATNKLINKSNRLLYRFEKGIYAPILFHRAFKKFLKCLNMNCEYHLEDLYNTYSKVQSFYIISMTENEIITRGEHRYVAENNTSIEEKIRIVDNMLNNTKRISRKSRNYFKHNNWYIYTIKSFWWFKNK